eukprot:2454351-Rhodomonas_salina.1
MATQRMKIYGPENETFVTCDCGCGTSAPASSFYHKISSCPKGGCSEGFLEKFKLVVSLAWHHCCVVHVAQQK